MNRKRILVLKSIDDRGTRDAKEYIAGSQKFKDFIIEFCYAIELHEYENTHSYIISYPVLLEKINAHVLSFSPDIIVLHLGFVFYQNPDAFLDALSNIKTRYPEIKIVYERPLDITKLGIYAQSIDLIDIYQHNEKLFDNGEGIEGIL